METPQSNNRIVAENRLESLKRRLGKDAELHQLYTETTQTYMDQGYAEPVLHDPEKSHRSWFLPHHLVMNRNKPGKVRVVFDFASRCMGVSLNDVLMQACRGLSL